MRSRCDAPRLDPPARLAHLCSTEPHDRLVHTYGKSYPEAVRIFARDFSNAPDVVATPRSEGDVVALLDWASAARAAAVIPFGGGSSVVGGVEPAVGDGFVGTVSLDLKGLDQVLEVDRTSRAARIQGGILGPALEAALKPHDLTLRHFPQSFECSTLGGWIATRSGGHFATLYTHIDDFVESLRVVTPAGMLESRRLPGSGAGPSPDRLMIGSEGALGVITEAWMRLQDRPDVPRRRGGRLRRFPGRRARRARRGAGRPVPLESAPGRCCRMRRERRERRQLRAAGAGLRVGRSPGRRLAGPGAGTGAGPRRQAAAGRGRRGGLAHRVHPHAVPARAAGAAAPDRRYLRDGDHLGSPGGIPRPGHERDRSRPSVEATARPGLVTCRFTHVYPDGAAPYFSFHAAGRAGALIEQWRHIKERASDAVIEGGGTITHHHAVGRDHMPWYQRQRPPLFGAALAAAKRTLDPAGILNPGVLVPVERG